MTKENKEGKWAGGINSDLSYRMLEEISKIELIKFSIEAVTNLCDGHFDDKFYGMQVVLENTIKNLNNLRNEIFDDI